MVVRWTWLRRPTLRPLRRGGAAAELSIGILPGAGLENTKANPQFTFNFQVLFSVFILFTNTPFTLPTIYSDKYIHSITAIKDIKKVDKSTKMHTSTGTSSGESVVPPNLTDSYS